jgi:Spy/CpxP family protein refolding chaperone
VITWNADDSSSTLPSAARVCWDELELWVDPTRNTDGRDFMRAKIKMVIFVASLVLFGVTGARTAQGQNAPPPPQAGQGQPGQQPGSTVAIGAGMPPQMMQMMGPMVRAQNGAGHGPEAGPLQMFSRFTTALDDASVRAKLGISDQQADSLRKIVNDTEIFTIQSAASIAVDSIQLKELLRPDKPDKAAVMSKGDEISKATSGLISHYLEAIVEAKTILTPEQQKKLSDYLDNGAPVMAPAPHRP